MVHDVKEGDATWAWIKESERMNCMKHNVPEGLYHPVAIRVQGIKLSPDHRPP